MLEKKILFLCKESFSFPLYFVAKKLMANNHVGALFVNPIESYYNKCTFNENTFYKFKDLIDGDNLYDMVDLVEEFNKRCDNESINYKYLEKIELDYSHFKNLNQQIISSQLLTRHLHHRFYFNKANNNQSLLYLELCYRKVINVIEEFKPDVILDLDDGELVRTIVNEVAYKNKIPYININYPRYDNYKIPTYCMGLKTDRYFTSEYKKAFSRNLNELEEEVNYIKKFRVKKNIMPDEFKGTTTSQYKESGLVYTAKLLAGKVKYFSNFGFGSGNYSKIKNNIIFDSPMRHLLFYFIIEIKRQFLFRENRYFSSPSNGDKYVYMPLHLIPESTTFVKAPFYINELNVIEQVSKALPIGVKLYVKEHQSMLGERPFSFYKKAASFQNVKIVQLNYYNDPKPWIENSIGVITITGTGAYEAALMGKKSIVFGDIPFSLIDGVIRIRSYEELPNALKSLGPVDNVHSCAAYLFAVKSVGLKINLKDIIKKSENILKGLEDYSADYDSEVEKLCKFYHCAYKRYSSQEVPMKD